MINDEENKNSMILPGVKLILFHEIVCPAQYNSTCLVCNKQNNLNDNYIMIYNKGDIIKYECKIYKCKRFHYGKVNINPKDAPEFWQFIDLI